MLAANSRPRPRRYEYPSPYTLTLATIKARGGTRCACAPEPNTIHDNGARHTRPASMVSSASGITQPSEAVRYRRCSSSSPRMATKRVMPTAEPSSTKGKAKDTVRRTTTYRSSSSRPASAASR